MTDDLQAEQEKEWELLYERIRAVLAQYGEEDDADVRKDYFVVDDNMGLYRHRIEAEKLELARPVVIESLQIGSQFGDIMYTGFSLALAPGPFAIHLPEDANIRLPEDPEPEK